MNKILVLLFVSVAISTICFAQKENRRFKIIGTVVGFGDRTLASEQSPSEDWHLEEDDELQKMYGK